MITSSPSASVAGVHCRIWVCDRVLVMSASCFCKIRDISHAYALGRRKSLSTLVCRAVSNILLRLEFVPKINIELNLADEKE